jgi:hypothetical protein
MKGLALEVVWKGGGCITDVMLRSSIKYHHEQAIPSCTEPSPLHKNDSAAWSAASFALPRSFHAVLRTTAVQVTHVSFADGAVVKVCHHGDDQLCGGSHLCSVVPAWRWVCVVLWFAAAGKVSASSFFRLVFHVRYFTTFEWHEQWFKNER